METVDVKLPSALLKAANLEESSLSEEAARLLALELYREDKVSLGRAAELSHTPLAAFMDVAGAGLPGAVEVSNAKCIEVKRLQNPAGLMSAQQTHALGLGEMSTILLAKELGANLVPLDDYKARKLAKAGRPKDSGQRRIA